MKKILVLCTGNSCRSQMAEGYLRHFAADKARVYSAGIETHGVNPMAIQIMQEDGIDLSGHTSNHINEYQGIEFDYVITVCDHAREHCPFFPSQALAFHYNFPDPSKTVGSADVIEQEFIRVRDLIKEYCRDFAAEYL